MSDAADILVAELARWRAMSYDELVALVNEPHHFTRKGASGREYGVEAVIVWDGRARQNIRVILDVSGKGGKRTADFILAPDGTFIDE